MAHRARFSALFALVAAAIGPACADDTTTSAGSGGSGSTTDTSASTGGATAGTGGASAGTGGATAGTGGATAGTGGATAGTGGAGGGLGTGGGGGPPTIRRPFLVGRAMRSAKSEARSDWQLAGRTADDALDTPTRDMLAMTWLQDAREEHASVAAFARWTLLMMSVGAPPELLRDAQRASIDEIDHAKACFSLARRYGGADVGPAPLDLDGSLGPMSLVDIAVLTAEEGCVGETLGVALARVQAEQCEDAEVKKLLGRLIVDEERHAKLAWTFVAWAIERGGDPVRAAVADAIARAAKETLEAPIRSYEGVDVDAWHAHGRLTCAESRDIAREAIAAVIEPALAMLARGPRAGRSEESTTMAPLALV